MKSIADTASQIKNVGVFKRRFGEASLAGCEVMIKDLQDSKRIDVRVHERAQVRTDDVACPETVVC